ncbi:MAG: ComF family protein [Bradymonadia bacterium]
MLSIAPQQCLICAEFFLSFGVCEVCFSQLKQKQPPRCEGCGTMISPVGSHFRCIDCLTAPPPFTYFYTSFDYLPIAGRLVKEAKSNARAKLLSQLLSAVDKDSLSTMLETVDVIVPIPDRRQRFWQRGFSAARMIASLLGNIETGPPVRFQLRWRKTTERQTALSRAQRQRNVGGSFYSRRVEGLKVLVVDDVCTTTSTLREATKALKRAGADEVRAYALCTKT